MFEIRLCPNDIENRKITKKVALKCKILSKIVEIYTNSPYILLTA